jgi:hypothetical protein
MHETQANQLTSLLITQEKTMNLELDFKFSKQNPNLEKYSQCPIEFRNDSLIILKNWRSQDSSQISSEYPLCDIDSFFDLVDEKEFAKITSMEYVRKFNERIHRFERYWGDSLRRVTDSEYRFETKKNFDWKNGIYDILKKAVTYYNGFNMRNSGVERLFIRVTDSRYTTGRLHSEFAIIERLRKDCKVNVGKVIENIEEVIEMQANELKKIQDSTIEANKMSSNFDIYNAINFSDVDLEPPYNGFLNLKLYTIVIMHPNLMNVVKDNGDLITKLPTPRCYLVFERQLSKVLLGKQDKNPRNNAAVPGQRHPYISTVRYYNLDTIEREGYFPPSSPWNYSLCLSSFTDDIVGSLSNNDYPSFLMGLSAWNNIYNNEHTNPHNSPSLILQDVGIDKDLDVEGIQTLQSFLGFRTSKCWEGNLYKHALAEDDKVYFKLRGAIAYNSYLYGDYVTSHCNQIECPLREKCNDYQNYVTRITSPDFEEMIESWTGWHFEYLVETDGIYWDDYYLLKRFHKIMHKYLSYPSNWVTEMRAELNSYDYWTVPSNDTPEEKADEMATAVENWTQHINSQNPQ